MAALTTQDLQHIAQLAKLESDPAIEPQLLAQLNEFFQLVEQMQAIPTDNVDPLYTPLSAVQDVHLRLRPDEITEPASEQVRDTAMRNAPETENGFFLVPKVIE